jgi:uncharacterized protein YgiM (DUF1202 family)
MFRPRYFVRSVYIFVAASGAFAVAPCRLTYAEAEPYEARVVATGAAVHSGPGDKFYPTDTLAQGEVVEVYREKSGGWLGIRPPANSFSWVSAADLDMRDGNLAVVNKDDVASRIGSRLNAKRNAAQVRLKKGEVVEVIDEETIGEERWYKIAPPAGEFRWIQSSLVERLSGVQMVSAETTEKSDAATPPLISTIAGVEPGKGSTSAGVQAGTVPVNTATSSGQAKPQAVGSLGVGDGLSHELASIELRLSRMVAAPVNLWNTERLERDATQLLSRAQTPAERDAVQLTLSKIKQFAVIGQRAAQVPGMGVAQNVQPPIAAAPGTPAQGMSPTAPLASIAPNAPGGPYDAVGVLRPVVSKRPGAPQFALVDDGGQVLSFVTPTPDVNLQPYLGRRVGVVGNKGFIGEFNRSHVTAARITPLGAPLVR